MELLAPMPARLSEPAVVTSGWRPPARLPDPALLSYVANALAVFTLLLALLHIAHRR